MIHSVTADRASFRPVEFAPGLNVVLADRTATSSKKDSRNGLGKTSLLEIIHFCLGSNLTKDDPLRAAALYGWTFTVELDAGGERLAVSRNTAKAGTVRVLPGQGPARELKVAAWNQELGERIFGLDEDERTAQYAPSFRSLISYVIRRGSFAYTHPFEYFPEQKEWNKQVHIAYLLGLAWRDASEMQTLRDKKKLLNDLQKAAKGGLMGDALGTQGGLEADRVRLQARIDATREELASFRVHPQYRQIEEETTELTGKIHALANENLVDGNLMRLYKQALAQEQEPHPNDLVRLYEAARVELPGVVKKRLDDLHAFHTQIVRNRQQFLAREIEAITARTAGRQDEIATLSTLRAERLEILRTHGALEEYTRLQERHGEMVNQLHRVSNRLEALRRFEEGSRALRAEENRLLQRAQGDYREREPIRAQAIRMFNQSSEALYRAPGRLVIDVKGTGFKFGVEIERSGAHGIESMKVFCFDLTLARLWAYRPRRPGFLIHDSTLFDPVDSRQRAHALELAARMAAAEKLQYICTMNSDQVPRPEFSQKFDFDSFVRLRLTDATPEGGLFGIRF